MLYLDSGLHTIEALMQAVMRIDRGSLEKQNPHLLVQTTGCRILPRTLAVPACRH